MYTVHSSRELVLQSNQTIKLYTRPSILSLQVLTFLLIQLTRRFEYQADQFSADLDKANTLQSALTKLNKDNLSFPIADPLYSMFHHSHPTFLERVRALAATKKRD